MPLSPGDVIADKYRIEKPLGEGRMGRVWVATHGVLRKQVALKVMEERFRVSPDLVERFFREAVAASKVDHPAITQVFDAGVHEDFPFMVMELLHGEDLDHRLTREGRLSLEETMMIARPILSALEAAHRAGVVHRDIKPPNIFLAQRPDGVVTPKLLDFGIAKHINDPFFDRLTASGSVLGTPLYLAPEQIQSDAEVDHRADVYGMGVTLFHCLSGTTPYEAASFPELIGKIFSEGPRLLRDVAPHLPPAVCDAIQHCLARDPKDRPPSAHAFLEELSGAVMAGGQDEEKTTAMEWGSERTPMSVQTPPTRYVPITPASDSPPPSPAPTMRESASEEAGTETPLAPAPGRRSAGAVLFAVAVFAVVGLGVTAGAAYWLFGRPNAEAPPATPATVVTTPSPPSPATNPLDAGAPMEPSGIARQGPAETASPAGTEGRAQLQIEADPPGECFIDGTRVGVTPITEWVSAGPHSVVVAQGPSRHFSEEVVLRAGEHRVLHIGAETEERE